MISDLGLLASRLALGLSLASHGAQKAYGWFEGPGPEGAAGFMHSLGLRPGETYAAAASYNEIVSGLLIALGLGGPLGPAGVVSNMIVAAETVHRPNGFYAAKGGIELPFLYAAAAVALASAGYGDFSVDHLFGLDESLDSNFFKALAFAGGVTAAYLILGRRDTSPPEGTLATPTIKGEHDGQPAGSPSSPATT
ncbi:MAG: DoxX family protein [Candidatus Eremiobacteraeota bacterium]|nr:DoxX family protein [Candidatus Eremiobacteraeota bacterium]